MLRNAKVIVVDDDEAVAHQLSLGLETQGFEVSVAHSMAQALDVLSTSSEISVAVTDIRMPGGSGLDLAQAIADLRSGTAATEVVIITGHAAIDDATIALRCGAADFLPKPFRLAEAVLAVTKAAERASKRRSDAGERSKHQAVLAKREDERCKLRAELEELERRFLSLSNTHPPSDPEFDLARTAVSHALRTPLNAISAGAALISDAAVPAGSIGHLELLRSGVNDAVVAIELVEELNRLPQDEHVVAHAFDVTSCVREVVTAFARENTIVATSMSCLNDTPLLVAASSLRIRRAITLCLEAAAKWAPVDAELRCDLRVEGAAACLTMVVSPAGQCARPPAGSAFADNSGALSRTQESLRFLIARRLVAHGHGTVTSWSGPPGVAAIRMALPLLRQP